MSEIIFLVEDAEEGGYTARALGADIFTESETMETLKKNIKDAVACHYEIDSPKIIRLHFVRDEILTI